MPIKIVCGSCAKTITAPDKYAGKTAKCPACGAVLEIPAPEAPIREAQIIDDPPLTNTGNHRPELPSNDASERDFFAPFAPIAGVVCPVLALLGVVLVLGGGADVAVIISGVCVTLAMTCITTYALLYGRASAARSAQKLAEKSATEAEQSQLQYMQHFDQIVANRLSELEEERKRRLEAIVSRELAVEEAVNRNQIVDRLGKRLLGDTVRNVSQKLTPNNFTASRDRLVKTIDFCRKHDYDVSVDDELMLVAELREQFEKAVRLQHDKEEQTRIKARIREEQRAENEIARELARVEAERRAIEAALAVALKEAADEHSEEVEALRVKLQEAEERGQRAMSMAQQTRAGHVYVISNIGSFGENVYKIGMTRRLEPMDRVKELGDASVPFPFDVHMMISCDDAPSLENTLHQAFHRDRINRVNLRKEFFRVDLAKIRDVVERNHGEVTYEATAEALEYHESQDMSEEDFDLVTSVDDRLSV